MIRYLPLGLEEALALVHERIAPLSPETIGLHNCVDRVVSEDLYSKVDSPSVDASLKDGYAVISRDVETATYDRSVRLKLTGCVAAGGEEKLEVLPGSTVQVLTGAKIPPFAEAVVSEEFTKIDGNEIIFHNFAEPGRNVLPKGSDVACDKMIVNKGSLLSSGMLGMLTAAGFSDLLQLSYWNKGDKRSL